MQFQMLAQINGLTDAQKATYLTVSLKRPALTVLSNWAAGLDTRFGYAHQAELYRLCLKNRVRSGEESLPELAEDIERLTRLAYPNATAPMIEMLAKDQFVDASGWMISCGAFPNLDWNQEIFVLGDESFVGNCFFGNVVSQDICSGIVQAGPRMQSCREQMPAGFCKAKPGCGTQSLNRH